MTPETRPQLADLKHDRLRLNPAATHVDVHLEGSLSAPELETLIHRLAELRAGMAPAVPDTRTAAIAADCALLEEDRPSITAAVRTNGTLRISMRNRGIGWLAAIVDRRTAHALGKYMSTATPEFDALNLIDDCKPQRH